MATAAEPLSTTFGLPGSPADPALDAVRLREYDIVTVPDFAGARSDGFELQALFFMASWLASGNANSSVRLQLACIGEPPESVQRLAERAGAILSVHEPKVIRNVRCANKFRGFEVTPQTGHLLLADTDVLFLGRMDELSLPPDAIAAAPAFKGRVQEKIWGEAYAAVDLEPPEERIWSQARELDCRDFGNHRRRTTRPGPDSRPMLPYYNAGVIFTPWAVPLGEVWERHIERVNGHLEQVKGVTASILRSDQTAFATSVWELRQRGVRLVRLPDAYHGHRYHVYRRKLRLDEIRLLHFTGAFSSKRHDPDPRVWTRLSVKLFCNQLGTEYRTNDFWWQPLRGFFGSYLPATRDGLRLARRLDRLYLDYVEPALKGAPLP